MLIEVRSWESLFKDMQHSINTPFALWQSSTAATLINMSPRPPTVNHKSPAGATGTRYSPWTLHLQSLLLPIVLLFLLLLFSSLFSFFYNSSSYPLLLLILPLLCLLPILLLFLLLFLHLLLSFLLQLLHTLLSYLLLLLQRWWDYQVGN